MPKINRKNYQTKKEIATSFKKILEQNNHKITINEIIKECGINRNTFYYHFNDIYDLINWIFNEEVSSITKNICYANPEELLNKVFDYVEENKHLLNSAYNAFGREQLSSLLKPYFRHALLKISENKKMVFSDENYKDFLINFYSEGITYSIINYFHEKKHVDKKTMIKYFLSLNDIKK